MGAQSALWQHLFMFGDDISVLEKIARTILVYLFLIGGLRLAGKRELAQLNPFDLVVLLLLSNTVQNAIIGNDNSLVGGLLGATTLFLVNYGVVLLVYKNRKLGELVEGGPDILMQGGRVREKRLSQERIKIEELEEAARRQGFASLREVDQAILYPGGTFCFIGKVPTADAVHHQQIMSQLHHLSTELAELKKGR
jgi:uncharacterized membrane protein YcaP (DUF421 family)